MAINYSEALSGKNIIDMIMGYQQSQVLCSACQLGVFEELHNSSIPLTVSTLSNRLRIDRDAAERLLNTCAALHLVEKDCNQTGDAVYQNAPATDQFLVKSSPMSMRPLANSVSYMYPMWSKLKDTVKDGYSRALPPKPTPDHDSMFGKNNGMFSDAIQLDFMQAMHMFSKMDSPLVAQGFDLSEFDSACDLGGGSGALGLHLANCYTEMQVTVYDLPHVVNVAAHFMPNPKPRNLNFEAGDFFEGPLPTADLYILSHVVHDWNQDKVQMLLKKIYESLRPGGALLLLEKHLVETKDAPLMTAMFDIGMLVVSEGRERTTSEYENLLQQAGFDEINVKIIPKSSFRDAVLARKLSSSS